MNEISTEQARLITDLESYKSVMGAKRFKRTAVEMAIGLSPEEALKRRLTEASPSGREVTVEDIAGVEISTISRQKVEKRKGDIVIHIRPIKGTDADYFEHVPQSEIVVEVDSKWYSWFDTRAQVPYNGDIQQLLSTVIDRGMDIVVGINSL